MYQGIVVDKDNQKDRAQGVHRRRQDGARRLDRRAEGRGLADAQGAGQPDDARRVRRPGPVPLRAGPARPLCHPDDPDDPAVARAQVGVAAPGRIRPRRRDAPRPGDRRPAPTAGTTVYAKASGALPLDDAAAVAGGSKVLYLQGEIDVSAAGTIRISPTYPEAIRYWLDDLAAPAGTREFTTSVMQGHHAVTVRVDTADRSAPRGEDRDRQAGRLHGRVHRRRGKVKSPLATSDVTSMLSGWGR